MASYRDAGHLPNNRPSGMPADPRGLPRQRRGTTPQMHGRYPDYDVLEQAGHWDQATRAVVLQRVHDVPPVRFFTPEEVPTLRALLDTVLAQDTEPRIPVLELVDAKFHARTFDGFRYVGMPDDGQTWKVTAAGLDESAGDSFAHVDEARRLELCEAFSNGTLSGTAWESLDVRLAWKVVMRIALSIFYAHPWAWNEIGFGGPRYPRGYRRLGPDCSESDEARPAFDLDPVHDVRERGLER